MAGTFCSSPVCKVRRDEAAIAFSYWCRSVSSVASLSQTAAALAKLVERASIPILSARPAPTRCGRAEAVEPRANATSDNGPFCRSRVTDAGDTGLTPLRWCRCCCWSRSGSVSGQRVGAMPPASEKGASSVCRDDLPASPVPAPRGSQGCCNSSGGFHFSTPGSGRPQVLS